MKEVIEVVSKQSKGEAILVTDVGQHQMIAQKFTNLKIEKAMLLLAA